MRSFESKFTALKKKLATLLRLSVVPSDSCPGGLCPSRYAPDVTLQDKAVKCESLRALNVEPLLRIERTQLRITLIGGPAGRAGWRAVFPNERREFRRAALETEGRAGGLHKNAVQRAFPQPTGPPLCAANRPILLCSLPPRPSVQFASPQKFHVIHLEKRPSSPPGPPAVRLVLSHNYVTLAMYPECSTKDW